MKKFLIALTIACSVLTMSAIANDVDVSGRVLRTFEKSFTNVSNVKWAKVKNLFQAEFMMDNQSYSAYFTAEGEMVVVARFITSTQLPHGLQQSLKKHAGVHQISYMFELSDEEGVRYYATIEKGGKKEMLRSSGTKKWAPYKNVKL